MTLQKTGLQKFAEGWFNPKTHRGLHCTAASAYFPVLATFSDWSESFDLLGTSRPVVGETTKI